jgi:hypothetical protein
MKKILLTILLSLGILAAYAAAPITLRGTVVDEAGEPMQDVTVYIKETGRNEVFSDSLGRFAVMLSDTLLQKTLVFERSDYPQQTSRINLPEKDIRFVMKKEVEPEFHILPTDDRFLPEDTISAVPMIAEDAETVYDYRSSSETEASVVGIGFGTTRDLTGAIEHISVEELEAPVEMMIPAEPLEKSKAADFAMADKMLMSPSMPVQENIVSGTLTSGEVNDFAKWNLWRDVLDKDFEDYRAQWGFSPRQRYMAQLTNRQGMPVANATVTLQLGGETLWLAKTDNTGKAELWNNFFKQETKTDSIGLNILFEYEGQNTVIRDAKPFEQGMNTVQIETSCEKRNKVDIYFMLDATGSMSDEMRYLQVELDDIINKVKTQQSDLELRTGSLVYRDLGDTYITRKSSLNKDINTTLSFLRKQRADGGGDYEEAVDVALFESINNGEWADDALARILFVVLDAPSHTSPDNIERLEAQLRLAAELGIRIVPIACSDIQKDGEYLMRTFALATNGTYLFLTDDSGVGNVHIKPSTDKYEVEKLGEAIVRVIKQYTEMPDCNDPRWAEERKAAEPADNFLPNPYDEKPEKGAAELTDTEVMAVYPNPCVDVLKVEIKVEDVQDVFLVDMTGKTLFNLKAPKRETLDFDVRDLSAGVYFVSAYYKGKWFSKKIIKK